jgi:hypothetical protein
MYVGDEEVGGLSDSVRSYLVEYSINSEGGLPRQCDSCYTDGQSLIPGLAEFSAWSCHHMDLFQPSEGYKIEEQGNKLCLTAYPICKGYELLHFAKDEEGIKRYKDMNPNLGWTEASTRPINLIGRPVKKDIYQLGIKQEPD